MEIRNTLLQWLIPALVAFGVMAAHFGYNEVRVGHLQDQVDSLTASVREVDRSQTTLEAQVIERLTRIETQQEFIIQGLDDLKEKR